MDVRIEASWKQRLAAEFEQPYFQQLAQFVRDEYREHTVYPPGRLIFNAFDQCPFEQIKVVIIGQDPYHGHGQANGLCFSVNDGVSFPPSLKNIFIEIQNDLGQPIPQNGNLERWAQQGVLLLNAILTVRAHQAASHRGHGWERFTEAVIETVSAEKQHVVFLLWGKFAQEKARLIDASQHCILTAAHPSPLSVSRFFGNRHFSRTNDYLTSVGKAPIAW
ncbi:MAG: uracil-DNA glycosylase [Pseudomonadota bacterium]|nr:uracil-DNA glycosylase [Pseudomonadota bacterium]